MLYDDVSVQDVVDSESALEFMKEATKLATSSELGDIGQKLEEKSRIFQSILNPKDIEHMREEDFSKVVGKIFSLRKKSKKLINANGFETLREMIVKLLYGKRSIEKRFNEFVDSIEKIDEKMCINFASELLHFSDPKQHWLWTNWIWDKSTNTGSLPLVIQDDVDLSGATNGDIYKNVGEAIKYLNTVGQSRSFSSIGKGLFGTDVLLACVYAVYMYTVFKVKLSQEFNRILPELPELTQRVLGVHNLEKN
jgi:hypothetical protein